MSPDRQHGWPPSSADYDLASRRLGSPCLRRMLLASTGALSPPRGQHWGLVHGLVRPRNAGEQPRAPRAVLCEVYHFRSIVLDVSYCLSCSADCVTSDCVSPGGFGWFLRPADTIC
jgi:hypothetical protein